MTDYNCPDCDSKLHKVINDSAFNDEQFDSMKAGDYFCQQCEDPSTKTGFQYFKESQLDSLQNLKDQKYL